MDASSGDLETKYQKIAAEYAKLRAQASVLKKAVVEEQSRNIELHDVLREREQNFRKSTQEIDSLTFRNQQLTKRVTVLQNELDATETRSKKGKSKMSDNHNGADCRLTMNVLDEELQKRILENAELVSRIHDEDATHKQEIAALNARVEKLEHELESYCKVNTASEKKFKAIIDKLETEKASSTFESGDNTRGFQDCPSDLAQLRQDDFHIQRELRMQIDSGTDIEDQIKKLKVPHAAEHQQYSVPVMIVEAGNQVTNLSVAMSDYHTFTEQRLHCLQSTLSPVNYKFSGYLKENLQYLQGIQLGFSELQTCVIGSVDYALTPKLQLLSNKLSAYTCYLLKLLPYQQLSLEEESAAMAEEEHLVATNKEVVFQINRVTNNFLKLSTYVKLLSSHSIQPSQHTASSQCRFFPELTHILTALAESLMDLSRAHAAKSCQEHENSEILRRSNNCIANSLSTTIVATEKLSNILSSYQSKLQPAELQSGTAYSLDISNSEESSSVPCREIRTGREHSSPLGTDTHVDQLAACRKRAIILEQEKEHWHLEYQLLQLKHSKQMEELEQQLMAFQSSTAMPNQEKSLLQLSEPCAITNLLGRLEAPLVLTSEMEAREREVKDYLTRRINDLVAVCQGAETKAVTFRAECAVLGKRLELSVSSKARCDNLLQETLKQVTKLQEELHTTTHIYETQLGIMSEHLANMNDKLTVQRDEIDQLKYQLTNKFSQKKKQK